MLRKTIIFFVLCFTIVQGWSITKAPTLIRACLNVADSTVTIDYSSISDMCGSFVEHHIYGSETTSAFRLLSTQKDFLATSVQFKLPNANPQWYFFFETRFKCNGADTAMSDTLILDSKPPTVNLIDSVSIDLLTQRPVIGWQKNDSSDTKGYWIYTRSNGINSKLADTTSLVYFVDNQPNMNTAQFALAAYDSCNLFSSISSVHSAISLKTSLDTCTKSASLIWTPYVGWITESQQLYVSKNGAAFTNQPIQPNNVSHSFPGIGFGDSVCFFIRARNETGIKKTTSSNVSCVKLNQPIIPKTTYLSKVSVLNKSSIEIEAFVENEGVADSVVLYSLSSGQTKIGSLKLNSGQQFYNWVDNTANTDLSSKVYFIRTFAPCLGGTSSSLNGESIHLTITDETLSWNPYVNWSGGLQEYFIYAFDGSTWNIIDNTTDQNYTNTDTTIQCFYVEAIENQNTYGFSRSSKSNTVCSRRKPQFYVPNTLNPLSKNHTFRVYGASIDIDNSTMVIFNRWGEQIYKSNNIKDGWSVDAATKFIPLGVYFYDIAIMDLNGHRHRLTGSVRVIR